MKYYHNIDLQQNELIRARVQNSSTAPTSPVAGQVYFNSSDNVLYVWNGTVWHDLRKIAAAGGSPITISVVAGVATIDINEATQSVKGAMSPADKTILDGATSNATANALAKRDGSGNMSVNQLTAAKVTGLAAPSALSDAANKQYVDEMVSGIKTKTSVRAATTANISLSGLQVIDGVTLAVGNRVLVKNQTTASANGIYLAQTAAWTRSTDMAAGSFGASVFAWIEEGTTQADSGWLCISDSGSDTVGTHALTFTQQSGAGQITAGTGLVKTGNVLSVENYTPVASSIVARKVVMTGSIGSGSAVNFTHNLNTATYEVQVFLDSTSERIYTDMTLGANSVAITANGSTIAVRVVAIG